MNQGFITIKVMNIDELLMNIDEIVMNIDETDELMNWWIFSIFGDDE